MNPTKRFSENLLILRAKLELSQEELGFRSGLDRTEISMLERGKRKPGLETLEKLSQGLHVPLPDLLAGIGWEESATGTASAATP